MLRSVLALSAASAALALPAGAQALTVNGPFGVPAGTRPLAAVPAPSGGAVLLVRGARAQDPTSFSGIDTLTVQRVDAEGRGAGAAGTISGLLLRDRPRPDGGDDLLIEQPTADRAGPARLVLARASADGHLRTLWRSQHPIADLDADVARDAAGRLSIAWHESTRTTVRVKIATSAGGSRFTAPRTLRDARGAALTFTDALYTQDMAVAVGHDGDPVVALAQYAKGNRTLVLRARRDGTVTGRQLFAGAGGLVISQQTPGGRIGLLIHDTGIEGEWGECVGDGQARKVFATTAEPNGRAFHQLRPLDQQSAYCPDGGAPVLVAGAGDQLVVAFGAIDDARQPADVRVAWSSPGAGFGPPATVWPGAQLTGLVADPRDGTLIAALEDPDRHLFGPGQGVSLTTRAPDGALAAPQRLSATGFLTGFGVGADGRVVAGVRELDRADPALFTAR
jgi:hypothetical protein